MYVIRFFSADWEELGDIPIGRCSAIGALNVVSDWMSAMTDDADVGGLNVAFLRPAAFITLEVLNG